MIFEKELHKHGDQKNASLADQEGVGWPKDLCDLANLSRETTRGCKGSPSTALASLQMQEKEVLNSIDKSNSIKLVQQGYLRHFEAIDRIQCSIGLPALIPPPSFQTLFETVFS